MTQEKKKKPATFETLPFEIRRKIYNFIIGNAPSVILKHINGNDRRTLPALSAAFRNGIFSSKLDSWIATEAGQTLMSLSKVVVDPRKYDADMYTACSRKGTYIDNGPTPLISTTCGRPMAFSMARVSYLCLAFQKSEVQSGQAYRYLLSLPKFERLQTLEIAMIQQPESQEYWHCTGRRHFRLNRSECAKAEELLNAESSLDKLMGSPKPHTIRYHFSAYDNTQGYWNIEAKLILTTWRCIDNTEFMARLRNGNRVIGSFMDFVIILENQATLLVHLMESVTSGEVRGLIEWKTPRNFSLD